jgi:hypothetical protein
MFRCAHASSPSPHCALRARSLARSLRLALFVVVQQQQHSPACSQPFFLFSFFGYIYIYIYSQKVILKLKSTKINCIFNNYFQYPLLEKKKTFLAIFLYIIQIANPQKNKKNMLF